MKYGAVILAAGRGARFHGTKQDVIFHGKPLWRWPFDLLCELVDKENIVIVGKDVAGGDTRTESVKIGLHAIAKNTERVVIVEAARPLVTQEQLQLLLTETKPSVSFVMPLVNTVVGRDGRYFNRQDMYELLTPQAFSYPLLCEAYDHGDFADMTDETRVMYEYHGIRPYFIETGQNLFKVTYPRDLAILESIYQLGKEENHD